MMLEPTPQEKLTEDLRRVRGLEKLLQRPNLSDRARSKLESALRMQKVAVKLARKAMTAPGVSGAKRAAGGSPPPRRARKKRDVSNPGPEALLEEFNRGFALDNHIREELNYDQLNALADMFFGWAFNEGSDPKRTAWLTGMAEGLLEEADTLGPDWRPIPWGRTGARQTPRSYQVSALWRGLPMAIQLDPSNRHGGDTTTGCPRAISGDRPTGERRQPRSHSFGGPANDRAHRGLRHRRGAHRRAGDVNALGGGEMGRIEPARHPPGRYLCGTYQPCCDCWKS